MKKFGIIVILLLVLTAGGISAAHSVIGSNLQNITVKETTLSGDKSQADGVTLHMGFLMLQSSSTPGFEASYSVEENKVFDCGVKKTTDKEDTIPHVFLGWEYPGYERNDVSEMEDIQDVAESGEKALGIPASEVLKQIDVAENGKKTRHTFVVADYLDYLPVVLVNYDFPEDIDLEYDRTPGVDFRYPEPTMLHSSYFQVPVPNDLEAILAIAKDKYGNVQSWSVDIHTSLEIESDGILSNETIYLATSGLRRLHSNGTSSHLMDMPRETHGIHRIPLEKRNQSHWLDMDKAECVYFFDQGEQVLQMSKSTSGKELLLYTKLNDEIFLSVIEESSMECLQKLSLGKELRQFDVILEEENYQFFLDENKNFVLVDITDGRYTKKFSGTLDTYATPSAIDYNGEKLAYATCPGYDLEGNNTNPYYYTLQIYTKQGLVYSGFFEPSLTSADQRAFFVDAIDVTFDKKKSQGE